MKKQTIRIVISIMIILKGSQGFAGLVWSRGSLTNPDNLFRIPAAIAYAADGTIYISGVDENTAGNKLIVTKKYSATGVLLNTITNSYFIVAGTTVSDEVKSISLDASGNVYVLGAQYTGSARGEDMVLIKYNSSLALQWKKYIYNTAYSSTNFNDFPAKLVFDGNNNIYVAGTWYQPGVTDQKQVVVRKYNTSGTVIYTATVSETLDTTVSDAADMSIDNGANVIVTAMGSISGNSRIMYAKVSNTGSVQWKKFYAPPANYSFTTPQIVCSSTGTFYISSSIYRYTTSYFGKIATAKFKSEGTKLWEQFSTEVNFYPNKVRLRSDASGDIYAGCDFSGAQNTGAYKYRIYKYNSSGTLQWSHVSSETTVQFFTFETFSNTAFFAVFYDHIAGNPKIKKFAAATGTSVWVENITTTIPSGYASAYISDKAIAINSATSELAFCGTLSASTGNPNFDSEFRWNIRKYGATTPRSGAEAVSESSVHEFKIELYPNPAADFMSVSCNTSLPAGKIVLIDLNGKIVKRFATESNASQHMVPVNDLQNGVYFVQWIPAAAREEEKIPAEKIIIQH